jgi:hypothetical protein
MRTKHTSVSLKLFFSHKSVYKVPVALPHIELIHHGHVFDLYATSMTKTSGGITEMDFDMCIAET